MHTTLTGTPRCNDPQAPAHSSCRATIATTASTKARATGVSPCAGCGSGGDQPSQCVPVSTHPAPVGRVARVPVPVCGRFQTGTRRVGGCTAPRNRHTASGAAHFHVRLRGAADARGRHISHWRACRGVPRVSLRRQVCGSGDGHSRHHRAGQRRGGGQTSSHSLRV